MRITFIIALIFVDTSVFAQVQGIDSLLAKPIQVEVILTLPQDKIDSIQNGFSKQTDSLKSIYQKKLSSVETARTKLQHKADSLQALNLPTEKITHKIDSINQLQKKAIASFNGKLQELKSKTTDRLKELNLPPELQSKASSVINAVDQFAIPVADLKIPTMDMHNPLQGAGSLNNSLDDIVQVDALQDVQSQLGDVSKITEQVGGYSQDIQSMASGNIDEIKQLPQSLEAQAAEISGANELLKETKALDQYTEVLGKVENPEALKDEAIEKVVNHVQQIATDHFAGKEQQLSQAMDKVSKYKKMYSNVNSLSEIPKRPPNPMKGKPFIERLVPGVSMQYQRKNDDYMLDVYSYAGYRITGRLTSGMGWNERLAFNENKNSWNQHARIFGPRVYAEFKLGKGFIAHVEGEAMNTIVPKALLGSRDAGVRDWVWGMMSGLKKEYKIAKGIRGTILFQYNLFDLNHRAHYADKINTRFGFEFPLKKSRKKAA